MKYHRIYLIPTPGNSLEASTTTTASLLTSIETHFETATRKSPWTLSHRLFQSLPPKPDPGHENRTHQTSLQHFLTLSPLSPDQTYCFIHAAPLTKPESANSALRKDPGTVITIPNAHREAHISIVAGPMSALWITRQVFAVLNGATYTAGSFQILVGELRAPRTGPSQSSGAASPGVVVWISTAIGADSGDEGSADDMGDAEAGYARFDGGGDDMDVDGSEELDVAAAKTKVDELWKRIRVDFGKANAQVVEMGLEGEALRGDEMEAVAKLWCDVLTPGSKA